VNATLSQTQAATPTSPSTSLKRPAPEDGEITDTKTPAVAATPAAESIIGKIQGAAQAQAGNAPVPTGTGARTIKRPRGAAPARGGAARRPSGPGQGQGGAGGAGGST
jgi:hypothetical protein